MDIAKIHRFYKSPLGKWVAEQVRNKIKSDDARDVLWLGYGQEFRRPTDVWGITETNLDLSLEGHSNLFFYQSDLLPFQPNSFNKIVVLHGFEFSKDPVNFLHNIWDALEGEGEFHMVVPNRTGFWARGEKTPFGEGRPYSLNQIYKLLVQTGFSVTEADYFLYAPSSQNKLSLRLAPYYEWVGNKLNLPIGGLVYTRCKKEIFRPKMIKETQKVFAVQSVPA